jgi:hypothetical protein
MEVLQKAEGQVVENKGSEVRNGAFYHAVVLAQKEASHHPIRRIRVEYVRDHHPLVHVTFEAEPIFQKELSDFLKERTKELEKMCLRCISCLELSESPTADFIECFMHYTGSDNFALGTVTQSFIGKLARTLGGSRVGKIVRTVEPVGLLLRATQDASAVQ